ncbi:MAG: hypothetical protein IJC83_02275, partial [Oscillospiraceae bacterium]|nr:hypothetical protein [Oscillospiraceae bacterium]
MKGIAYTSDDISAYIKNSEYIANKYIMKCNTVAILLFSFIYLLNILGIFIIDSTVIGTAFIICWAVYIALFATTKFISLSNSKLKYFLLFGTIAMFTILNASVTYHAVLLHTLPLLYATLYSSKRVMIYVYMLTAISIITAVYVGYFYGLCDANMALLTAGPLKDYAIDGVFIKLSEDGNIINQINPNPFLTLFLFFAFPRCIISITFGFVCSTIYRFVSGSIEKA